MYSGTYIVSSDTPCKPPLANCIMDAECCGQCGLQSHTTNKCRFLGQTKCGICERFGHKTEDCYSRKAKELKHKGKILRRGEGRKRLLAIRSKKR